MLFGPFLATAGALAGALAALAVYHFAAVRPAQARVLRLLELHDTLISGGVGSAADRIGTLEASDRAARAVLDRLEGRLGMLESVGSTDLSRAGFVRYDAFAGTGVGLSYALALLNRQGDGVVLTSIYSRDDTRTFGKPVAGFKPTVQASDEELEAIERARTAGP
jgi:hypothetical protein